MAITPEELCQVGREVAQPEWPKGTRQATKDAFELGKQAAADAILDRISSGGSIHMMFWHVRPKPFSPPQWMVEDDEEGKVS